MRRRALSLLLGVLTSSPPANAMQPLDAGERLHREAELELAQMKTTRYQHQSQIDRAEGVFNFDCSGFLIEAVGQTSAEALQALQKATVPRPLAKHFVKFFQALPTEGRPWHRVTNVHQLKPGDVIAWLKPDEVDSTNTGHIVIVDTPPTPRAGTNEVEVAVVDATAAPHGKQDARKAAGRTGLGKGTIILITDAAGVPTGYRWSLWEKSPRYQVPVVMARLED